MFGWLVLTLRNYRIGTTHKNHVPSPTHPPKKENIEETKIIIIITSSHFPVGFLKKKKKKRLCSSVSLIQRYSNFIVSASPPYFPSSFNLGKTDLDFLAFIHA
jgi:hypothetical protein